MLYLVRTIFWILDLDFGSNQIIVYLRPFFKVEKRESSLRSFIPSSKDLNHLQTHLLKDCFGDIFSMFQVAFRDNSLLNYGTYNFYTNKGHGWAEFFYRYRRRPYTSQLQLQRHQSSYFMAIYLINLCQTRVGQKCFRQNYNKYQISSRSL